MSSIEEEINEILKEQSKSSESQKERTEQLSFLREKIKNGEESTGDPIKDFMLAYYLEQKMGVEEKIISLEKDISNNQGIQIFVIKEEGIYHPPRINSYVMYCMPPMGNMGKNKEENIGILDGNLSFNMKAGNLLIPTKEYVARGNNLMNINTKRGEGLQKGPIKINYTEFVYLNESIPDTGSSHNSRIFNSLRILIGDEFITYFYKMPTTFDYYGKKFWELIEKKMDGKQVQKEIDNLTNGKQVDSFYYEALKLLGQKVPKEYQERYDKQIYEEKVEIINKLNKLIEEETELSDKIEKLYGRIDKRPKLGGRILYETEPSIPGLDEDDIAIISYPLKEKLKKIKGEIKGYLKQAINLDMDKEKLILKTGKPGITINVPEFISGLHKNYK